MLTALQAGRGNPPEPLLFERRKFLLVFYVRDAHVRVLRDVLCVRRVSRFRLRRLREAADFCAGVLDLPCNYKKGKRAVAVTVKRFAVQLFSHRGQTERAASVRRVRAFSNVKTQPIEEASKISAV